MRLILALMLLTAGCESGAVVPQDAQPHAYLLLRPSTEQKGWDTIEAMRNRLPVDERKRIRTAGPISSEEATMYIDFDGDCAASFVEAAQRIAEQAGVPPLACSETLPGAL